MFFVLLVRCMWAVPDPCTVILSHQRCPPDPEVDQVVVLTLSGKDMSRGLSLLHRALTGGPDGGFEDRLFYMALEVARNKQNALLNTHTV